MGHSCAVSGRAAGYTCPQEAGEPTENPYKLQTKLFYSSILPVVSTVNLIKKSCLMKDNELAVVHTIHVCFVGVSLCIRFGALMPPGPPSKTWFFFQTGATPHLQSKPRSCSGGVFQLVHGVELLHEGVQLQKHLNISVWMWTGVRGDVWGW